MSERHDFLKGLLNEFECPEPWEAMPGADGCRFCGSCRREVLDFERLTPRQLRSRLEAGRGQVCGRMTRDGGLPRMMAESGPAPRRPGRGAFGNGQAPLAAGLLGAFLGLGAVAAQPTAAPVAADASSLSAGQQGQAEQPSRRPARAAGSAALSGRVVDHERRGLPGATVVAKPLLGGREFRVASGEDGVFVFDQLPAGLYDLEAELKDYEISPVFDLLVEAGRTRETELRGYPFPEGTVVMGRMGLPRPGLRELYDQSELVVAAVVQDSEIVAVDGSQAEVATRLIVERRLKGTSKARQITYRHAERLDEDGFSGEAPGALAPGDQVLGFLVAAPDGGGAPAGTTFRTIDFRHGLRRLEGAEREAYVQRLEDLARLERRARGGYQPAELMDWLVETAEHEPTRGEAIGEIAQALAALRYAAEQEGLEPAELGRRLQLAFEEAAGSGDSPSPAAGWRPILLGAGFSELHRQRLFAALMATDSLSDADRTLFGLVGDWDPEAAEDWAAKALGEAVPSEPAEAYGLYLWLLERAEELAGPGDEGPAALFAQSAEARWEALRHEEPATAADERRLNEKRLALLHQLMAELAALLEGD